MNAAIDQQCEFYQRNGLEKKLKQRSTKYTQLKESERPHYQGICRGNNGLR
jgi:hypothetical protein